jgi:hypothetical protein
MTTELDSRNEMLRIINVSLGKLLAEAIYRECGREIPCEMRNDEGYEALYLGYVEQNPRKEELNSDE